MKGLCDNCPRRATCTELCAEAQKYANQDFVARREIRFHVIPPGKELPDPVRPRELSTSKRKALIVALYNDGRNISDIAWHVECRRQYVQQVLRKAGLR